MGVLQDFPKFFDLCVISSLAIASVSVCVSNARAEGPARLGEINVSAEAEHEVAETPSSFATVIRPAEQHVSFDSASDMISQSAGVDVKSLGGLGQFSTVSIRGSSAEQVSVYLDGVKLNTSAGGAFDFSTIPIDIIDRIEIIRGGGTAQFGSDAIGGVINIVTKKAVGKRSVEAFGGGGSFTTMKLGGSYRENFEKNNLTLSLSHLQSKGDFKFKTNGIRLNGAPSAIGGGRTYTRIHNSFTSESFLLNWGHRFSDNLTLDFLNDFFFTYRDVPGMEEETTLLYPQNPLDAKEKIFRNVNSISLNVPKFFIEPVNFSLGITNNLDVDRFTDATPAIGGPINVKTSTNSFGAFSKWDLSFDHKFMAQFITFRYDYRLDYLKDSSPIPNTQLTGKKQRNLNTIFIQDELSFWKDRIIFSPGYRFETASDFSNESAFKVGLKISPIKWIDLKGNFQRAFRFPGFNELYFPDQGYIRGNPALRPEKSWNLDAGIEFNSPYASISTAYFKNWVLNSIIFVPISATTIAPVNTYKVDEDGIEIDAVITPVKYVNLHTSYTYLDAHYASNKNQLAGRPKHEVNNRLELSCDFSKKIGGSVFGTFNYKSAIPVRPDNSVFLASRSRLDLGLNLRFAKFYYITFEAKDVTDVQIYDVRGFPLPRRSFFATLGAKWS